MSILGVFYLGKFKFSLGSQKQIRLGHTPCILQRLRESGQGVLVTPQRPSKPGGNLPSDTASWATAEYMGDGEFLSKVGKKKKKLFRLPAAQIKIKTITTAGMEKLLLLRTVQFEATNSDLTRSGVALSQSWRGWGTVPKPDIPRHAPSSFICHSEKELIH